MVIKSRTSKNDNQYNGQKNKETRSNKDLQNTKQKTKGRERRTPPNIGVNAGALDNLLHIQKKNYDTFNWNISRNY